MSLLCVRFYFCDESADASCIGRSVAVDPHVSFLPSTPLAGFATKLPGFAGRSGATRVLAPCSQELAVRRAPATSLPPEWRPRGDTRCRMFFPPNSCISTREPRKPAPVYSGMYALRSCWCCGRVLRSYCVTRANFPFPTENESKRTTHSLPYIVKEHSELVFGAMRNGADIKALVCAIPMRQGADRRHTPPRLRCARGMLGVGSSVARHVVRSALLNCYAEEQRLSKHDRLRKPPSRSPPAMSCPS